jgi:hypothetical protein
VVICAAWFVSDVGQKVGMRILIFLAIACVSSAAPKILNVQSAKDICDLLHPKLKSLFKDVPCDSITYGEVLEPGTKVEIREIPDEWSKVLSKSLSEIESVMGVRPTYALWITVRGKVRTMTSVVQVGESWYLTPGVPQEQK